MEDFDLIASLKELAFRIVPDILLAILTLVVGLWIIKRVVKLVRKPLERSKIDESLVPFLTSLLGIALKVMLVITIASMLGVETTSFVAVIGAAGLAVGLALQGSLANFAGGVMILVFKPFKVGDYIEGQGHSGTVDSIKIIYTVLKTPDNKTIVLPNGPLAGDGIVNYSTEPRRRLDLAIGIGYDDDILQARAQMHKLIEQDGRVINDPAPQVVVSELGDSAVVLSMRMWVKGEDYWPLKFDMTEKIKLSFDEEEISFPYPQMDVHLDKIGEGDDADTTRKLPDSSSAGEDRGAKKPGKGKY